MLLKIEKLVYGGDGLARDDGRVVLAPFVLPGEQAEVETGRVKNDLLRGRVTELKERSACRVEPPCEYFQSCGGCHYQHATYEYQVEQKRSILREVLERVGKIQYDGEIETIHGEPWAYRNRAQLHIANGSVGYFEAGSRRLCPIEHCPISSPKLNDAIRMLRLELPDLARFEAGVELFTNETDLQCYSADRMPHAARSLLSLVGTPEPIVYAGFRVSRGSFFQVNRFLIDRLVEAAAGDCQGALALDLYAGVGLFSRPLKTRFDRVLAVEAGASAYRDLRFNAPEVQASHLTAEEYLGDLREVPDVILADPPRAGLGKQVVMELARIRANQLRVVSCDPSTLARDLKSLLACGYRIEQLTLIDLFPQTFHIETVVHLKAM